MQTTPPQSATSLLSPGDSRRLIMLCQTVLKEPNPKKQALMVAELNALTARRRTRRLQIRPAVEPEPSSPSVNPKKLTTERRKI